MEEFKRILIATDGSEYTKTAVEKGLSLAKLIGAKVTALYVIDMRSLAMIPPDEITTPIYEIMRREGEEAVAYVENLGKSMGVEVETVVLEGNPAEEIIRLGKDHDMIVMGTLGKSGLERLLMGSVAEKVVRHAPCPVFLIRVKKEG
ncbi:MAG: universal stress protein [Thermoplasmata archaeon]|nr:MAG: universal stress protein [Thermoplasmata archaeon]